MPLLNKKILYPSIILVLILIIIAFSAIVITCDFQCVSTTYINKYEKDVEYYLGYGIDWESFVNPVIKDIYLSFDKTPTSISGREDFSSGGVESPSEAPMFCFSRTSSLDEHNQVANNLNYDNIDVDFVIYENNNNL